MKKMDDICWGCFGASFGDCDDCPTRRKHENELDVDELKMYSDLHEEKENGEKKEVL